MTIDELKTEMENAQKAFKTAINAYREERRIRIDAATAQIDKDMAGDMATVTQLDCAAWDAKRAYELAYAEDRASSSFTFSDGTTVKDGDVVSMVESTWRRYKHENRTLTGVVEVVNPSTIFPKHTGFKPRIGEFIVRICTADGKVGLRFDKLFSYSKWRPVK